MKEQSLLPLAQAWVNHHGPQLKPIFKNWKLTERVPPVLLLTGRDGSGKREIAHWIAQWLLCEKNSNPAPTLDLFGSTPVAEKTAEDAELEPCGTCSSCLKAIHQTWVDFSEIGPEEEGASIKIDEFKRFRASLGWGAFSSRYRITLIHPAESLTPQAANSLLKVLEEPPPGFIFILTATDSQLLLPTLVSRCQKLRLESPNPLVLRSLLMETDPDAAKSPEGLETAIREAQGNAHRARAALHSDYWKLRDSLFSFLQSPWTEIEGLVSLCSRSEESALQLLDQLDQLTYQLCSRTLEHASLHPQLNSYAERVVKKLGKDSALAFWIKRAEEGFKGRAEAALPLNKKLWVQEILSQWALH